VDAVTVPHSLPVVELDAELVTSPEVVPEALVRHVPFRRVGIAARVSQRLE
jgi:hypothetical protein